MASRNDFEQARRRSEALQERLPRVVSARFDAKSRRIVIELSSRLIVSFLPDDVEGLQGALPAQLSKVEISPSGFGIHFPALDADL